MFARRGLPRSRENVARRPDLAAVRRADPAPAVQRTT
jgi:hypothetical protein